MGLPVALPGLLAALPAPVLPPIWREGRFPLELAHLASDPVFAGEGVPDGEGRPVLLVPGFLAGDNSLKVMSGWLRRCGYHTHRAGIRINVDCSAAACLALERRLEEMAERHGQPVAIVGQSRGGTFAKALAASRPELVSGVVTLGSPLRHMLAVHPLVLANVLAVAALGSLGRRGFFTFKCLQGDCCDRFREALDGPFPEDVRYVCMYSRSDGIVDWRACLDPEADEHLEVHTSHCGMSVAAEVYRLVGDLLPRFAPSPAAVAPLARAA